MLSQRIDIAIKRLSERIENTKTLLSDNGFDIKKILSEMDNNNRVFTLSSGTLKDIRIACIMDKFSYMCYSPECILYQLTPANWASEVEDFKPDMLFIESAWEGKDDLWKTMVSNCKTELYDLIMHCHDTNIPVVFWCKEDPVHFDTFLSVAQLADFVFTTDIDCVPSYRSRLKHNRVYHLHFAAQPTVHNPVEKYSRKNKFCFAGSYYHKYKERAETFDRFAKVFDENGGFDIYDRNHGRDVPAFAFPKHYEKNILGVLAPNEIDIAYKGYIYSVNMNSIKQSQSMFARRVFEVLASNSISVGNFSKGVRNYFGDLTISTDDVLTLEKYLSKYCFDKNIVDKYRLLGLRKVLEEHLYEDRLGFIVQKVFGKSIKPQLPFVTIFSMVETQDEMILIAEALKRQTYQNFNVIYISDSIADCTVATIISKQEANQKLVGEFTEAGYIAVMRPSDYYGKNYLLDLVLTIRYGNYCAIGKEVYYQCNDEAVVLNNFGETYKPATKIPAWRGIAKLDISLEKTVSWLQTGEWIHDNMFSTDQFNYCENFTGSNCYEADDINIANTGLQISDFQVLYEDTNEDFVSLRDGTYEAAELLDIPPEKLPKGIRPIQYVEGFAISSSLYPNDHVYIYAPNKVDLQDIAFKNNKLTLTSTGTKTGDITCVCVFYDAKGKKLSHTFFNINNRSVADVPDSATSICIGLRIKGAGEVCITSISLGDNANAVSKRYITTSPTLILTKQYPQADDLYKYMFVHARVKAYKDSGLIANVMRINKNAEEMYREFDGIDIIEGHSTALTRVLDSEHIKTVCVHMLEKPTWDILKDHLGKVRIIIWLHGAEIQPWWRRTFDHEQGVELERAKQLSAQRQALWSDIFSHINDDSLHFVFVSQYFADEVMEDYNIKLPEEKYSIIHNMIDTSTFNYVEKDIEQRKRIFSCRPFASRKYANDLTAKAIQALSKHKEFSDMHFHIAGMGELYKTITSPLKKFKNVTLEERHYTHEELAALHKEYGVCLMPTRMDAQGVSRDEAMSSGLIPISNAVAAVPEFVDDNSGILVPSEDYTALADAILRLYRDPNLFSRLSQGAAMRVRVQSDAALMIEKELEVIRQQYHGPKREDPLQVLDYFDMNTGMLKLGDDSAKRCVEQLVVPLADRGGDDLPLKNPDAIFTYSPPSNTESIHLWIRSLSFLTPLLQEYERSNSEVVYSAVRKVIISFLKYMENKKEREWYSSEDHAMYVRTVVLLKALHVLPFEQFLQASIIDFLKINGEWLVNFDKYSSSNHGVMQCYGVLYMAAFLEDKERESYSKKALNILGDIIKTCFDKDGFCSENTPGYWRYNINLYTAVVKFAEHYKFLSPILDDIKSTIARAKKSLGYVVRTVSGGSEIPPIGDSPVMVVRDIKSRNATKCFARGGFFVSKDDNVYFSFKCGWTSKSHKHADETSITLSYLSQDIFIDSGFYDYDWGGEMRPFLASPRAHAGVYPTPVLNMTYHEYIRQASEAKIDRNFTIDGNSFSVSGGYTFKLINSRVNRQINRSGDVFIIKDSWNNKEPLDMHSRFPLHPDAGFEVTTLEGMKNVVITMKDVKATIAIEPENHLNDVIVRIDDGWYSPRRDKVRKNKIVDVILPNSTSSSITLTVTLERM